MGGPGNIETSNGQDQKGGGAVSHIPVLLQTVLGFLAVRSGGVYVDGTVGGGGHAAAILEASAPDGRLLGIDRDQAALEIARRRLSRFGERVTLRHGSFIHLTELARDFAPVDGVLLDLGLSSLQLEDAERGFAFSLEGPLDMRFDRTGRGPTAADLVNALTVKELADLLYRYGEERQSRRIAQAIAEARPLQTTTELAEVISAAVGGRRRRIHPATRAFQALRIAVNDELAALEAVLPQAIDLLKVGGRLVVISFHSLEDRIVKHFLRREESECICPPEIPVCMCDHRPQVEILTSKPVRPSPEEVERNPRSRSARLRAAERIDA